MYILCNTMESISLKMEENLLQEIDSTLASNRYSTRTEFIRDAIRKKLSTLEKEKAIQKLAALKGSLKSKKGDEEVGAIAIKKLAQKLNIDLN